MKVLDIDSIGLFNIARYTASMPLLPSALPPKGEARRYVANDFLNLITLLLARRPASWESSRHFRFLGSLCYNVKKC